MAPRDDADTVREMRLRESGSDEDALEQRRMVEKLIRDGDELAIPSLVRVLDNHLSKPNRRSSQAATKAAVGLGKLCRSGTQKYKTKSNPDGTTIENLLVRTLHGGSNSLQCAAADALARVGSEQARNALKEQAGGEGFAGDKSATVRARAKIALRRLDVRGGLHRKHRTAEQVEAIIRSACKKSGYDLVPVGDDGGVFKVEVKLGERAQTVHITTNNTDDRKLPDGSVIHSEYVLMYTPCGPANKEYFDQVLKLNALKMNSANLGKLAYGFAHGSLGLYQGQIVMIETQLLDTVDEEEIRTGIQVLATTGDEIEKQLTGGGDKR